MQQLTADTLANLFRSSLETLAEISGIDFEMPEVRFAQDDFINTPEDRQEVLAITEHSDLARNPLCFHEGYCVLETYLPEPPENDIEDIAYMAAGAYLARQFIEKMNNSPWWYKLNGKGFEAFSEQDAKAAANGNCIHRHFCKAGYSASNFVTTYSSMLLLKRNAEDAIDDRTLLGLIHNWFEEIKRDDLSQLDRVVKISSNLGNFATIVEGPELLKSVVNINPDNFHVYLNTLYRELEKTK